jgi:hypothetical protein
MNILQNRRRRIDRYKILKGCEVCGYHKHPSALCFDHLKDKSDITKNGYSKRSCAGGMYRLYSPKYSVKQLMEEIRKCRLLCSNCHMEITHSKKNIKSNFTKIFYLIKSVWYKMCNESKSLR